ncbi:MAG: hypothetical protein PHW11_04325 [Anaerolineaceae bacterium]|nr:hypothetical protein [Anaerolineaceae bacterium]MDD4042275.1 hypothetical protein [Anaerolineaceae bacterium]MDD4578837.1 hypothetical protein [Anaerolineaceae bacterium]
MAIRVFISQRSRRQVEKRNLTYTLVILTYTLVILNEVKNLAVNSGKILRQKKRRMTYLLSLRAERGNPRFHQPALTTSG